MTEAPKWHVLVEGKPVYSGSVRTANVVFDALVDSFKIVSELDSAFASPAVCFCKDLYGGV